MKDEKEEMRNEEGDITSPSGQGINGTTISDNIADVDLQALAEAIVALLKQELRLENERHGR